MDAARWQRSKAMLAAALEQPAAARVAFIQASSEDPAIVAEVLALLAAHNSATGALDGPADALLDTVPDRIGPYRPLRVLGRGGMGVVYLAERIDGGFAQTVALKVIASTAPASEQIVTRFERERALLARLQHPHIAMLHDGGVDAAGAPWFAMEYVDGAPLDQWCDAHSLSISQRLKLMLQVLDAVDFAHRRLVVHRDIKPGNILVTATGTVKLLDFGIARSIDPTAINPSATMNLLTPRYASPEQVLGDQVGIESDIYSLGVLLFELLSGRSPYQDLRVAGKLVRAIAQDPPASLRAAVSSATTAPEELDLDALAARRGVGSAELKRALDADLEQIVGIALAKPPEERYRSAAAMRDDILAYLAHRPLLSKPTPWPTRLRKLVRRHRWITASLLLALAAVVTGTALTLWQASVARERAASALAVRQLLSDMFVDVDPYRFAKSELTVRQLLDQSLARLNNDESLPMVLKAQVLADLGRAYFNVADQSRGLEILREAHLLSQNTQGMPRDEQLAILLRYGNALRAQGQSKEAREVFSDFERLANSAKPGSELAFSVALTRAELAEPAAAVAQFDQLLRDPIVRTDPERALEVLRLKADALANSDQPALALGLWREIVARTRAHGTPVALARALHNLALALNGTGAWPEQLQICDEALALYTREIGAEHANTLNLRNIRAGVLVNLGRIEAAEAEFDAVIEIQRRLNGTHVIASLINRSFALRSRFASTKALALLDEAITRSNALELSARGDLAGGAQFGRAEALVGLGELTQARTALDDILAQRRAADGDLRGPLLLDARLKLRENNPAAALAAVNSAIALELPEYLRARAITLQGCAELALGKSAAAIQSLEAAVALNQTRSGSGDIWPAIAERRLAQALRATGDSDRAAALDASADQRITLLQPSDDDPLMRR